MCNIVKEFTYDQKCPLRKVFISIKRDLTLLTVEYIFLQMQMRMFVSHKTCK